ncbi:MAG: YaiO family outer membrane beta-barrel protein [Gammaproteobacteria bacterium]|nr:YaiO family outer membrane beta-barrel protein [Gammaproteobacteria bacterium]
MISHARIVTGALLVLMATAAWSDNRLLDTAEAAVDAGDLDAAANILALGLADEPDNEPARYLYARVLSWNGRLMASEAQYDLLLSANPNNADYLLGKAQVLVWSDKPEEALPLLDRASSLAPGYEEISTLQVQALQASAGSSGSLVASSAGYIEAGLSWQGLTNNLPDWSSLYIDASRRLANGRTLVGGLRQTERFDQSDLEARGGVYWPVASDWTLLVEATVAPDADVLPEWSGFGELSLPIANGYGLRFGYRYRSYAANDLNTVTLSADGYLADFFGAWTMYVSKLSGADTTLATQFRLDRYYSDASRIGVLVAFGDETESVGAGQFIESDTFSLVLTGMHWLTPVWGLSWDVGYQEQGDFYERGGVRVGLRRQF